MFFHKKIIHSFFILLLTTLVSCTTGTNSLVETSLLQSQTNDKTNGCGCSENQSTNESSFSDFNNTSDNHDNFFYRWNNDSGLCFTNDDVYVFDEVLTKVPLSFEATIEIEEDYKERGGIIIGNYEEGQSCINVEIYADGHPRIYFCNTTGEYCDLVFYDVFVNKGEKTHLAIVNNNTAGLIECYVDGKLEQSIENQTDKWMPTTRMRVGSDARINDNQFFKGTIYNVALFASVRNETDINNDMIGVFTNDDGLLAAFELTASKKQRDIVGINQGIKLLYDALWLPCVEQPKNFAYSFAIIGDTQIMNYKWPSEFHNIYDYVINQKEYEKIAYCIGLGDITDRDTDSEWSLAKEHIYRMNGVVPYAINRGNHDSKTNFNRYFGSQREFYYSTITGLYNGTSVENSFRVLKIKDQKYLIFTLDYGVPDDVIAWVENTINQYNDCRIIISTHSYLFRDGTTLDENDVWPPSAEGADLNNGDQIWEKLIKKYNIDLLLCGHDPTDDIVCTQTKNDNGKLVTQILVDPQGIDLEEPTGMIALLYFSQDGRSIDIRYYSTVKNMWLKRKNQFSITI